jgi:tRNA A37 threonylcarbamoyladenosine biosynthesis protein TsaE
MIKPKVKLEKVGKKTPKGMPIETGTIEIKHLNPVVQDVIDRFMTVYKICKVFVTGNSAQKGIIISGDAGTGKSHYVKQAFVDTNTTDAVDYNKSKTYTAAAFYVRLFLNKEPGDVVVFDDCSLEHITGKDFKDIVSMLLGATEMTKGERIIGWERATKNELMKEHNVPSEFDFQGSIIWITNSSFEQLAKKFGAHWEAFQSRFIQVPIRFNEQEKLLYTLYLLEEVGMLTGKKCETKEGGYSKEIVSETISYIRNNYKYMNNVTARVAAQLADTMEQFPDDWETLIENQTITTYA